MSSNLYIGMGPPYVVRAVIPKGPSFDLAEAVAASAIAFVVTKSTGLTVYWPATVKTSSATSLTLEHALATSELDVRGTWRLWARFTLANGGELRTSAVALQVLDRNQVP